MSVFTLDLSLLKKAVDMVGANNIQIDFERIYIEEMDPIELELLAGKEIDISQVESQNGILSHAGRQVLLYIKDHVQVGSSLEELIKNPVNARRFHVTECKTLHDMRSKNKFDRYVVTNRLDGNFTIAGKNIHEEIEEAEAQLKVCRYCLSNLNYKNYKNVSQIDRNNIVNNFSIEDFFLHYISFFSTLPSGIARLDKGRYSKDWRSISDNIRKKRNYICEECGVDLSSNRNLLDTHHKNSIKSDNRESNLRVLCKDCHRREPSHSHIIRHISDIENIIKLRISQGILENISSWDDIYKYSDPALHGIIGLLQAENIVKPKLYIYLQELDKRAELFWKHIKKGITIGEGYKASGYTIYSHKDIINNYGLIADFR